MFCTRLESILEKTHYFYYGLGIYIAGLNGHLWSIDGKEYLQFSATNVCEKIILVKYYGIKSRFSKTRYVINPLYSSDNQITPGIVHEVKPQECIIFDNDLEGLRKEFTRKNLRFPCFFFADSTGKIYQKRVPKEYREVFKC